MLFLSYIFAETLFHIHFRLQAAIFDISLSLTKESLRKSAVMLLDPENISSRWNCVVCRVFKLRYSLFHIHFRL